MAHEWLTIITIIIYGQNLKMQFLAVYCPNKTIGSGRITTYIMNQQSDPCQIKK